MLFYLNSTIDMASVAVNLIQFMKLIFVSHPHEVIFSFLNLHCGFNPFMVQATIVFKVADIMDSSL